MDPIEPPLHAPRLPQSLNIISLNCWGLKFLAKHRHERLSEIGNQLAKTSPAPEIVGLQECWTQQDYLAIRERTKHFLPYGKFYWSGIFGGGLAILSKWPIEESSMWRYPLNGRPTAFFRGDWFVGKGVAHARIRIGPGHKDVVEVFNTHLHAPYEREPNDSYICHRTAQAWEIAKLMRGAAERGHLVLGLGDFNMIPLSLAHRLIETHAPVKDLWRILHPDSAIGAAVDKVEKARGLPVPSSDFCLTEHGTTCDSRFNTWRWNKREQKRLDKGEELMVDGTQADPKAKRLDYIFFGGDHHGQASQWRLENVKVGMLERHPVLHCSLSDHFSVEATLVRASASTSASVNLENGHGDGSVVDRRTDTKLFNIGPSFLPVESYDQILDMIHSYDRRERRQRRLRLTHFGVSILISIGCFIAVWWSPRNFVAFILILLSSLGLSAGVIDGLMGGLFVGSELRALREFEWEITNARSMASAQAESKQT
ncbi:hypothetical protein AAFC00_001115 [Neodothiora populina]|uniref:Endonuclease/exonuclease/phosphatase domain-containing protein n=1 Tax=Neodothiora populina TaxID=2781224 RepID=A0ABR3PNU9_9PEZI